MTSPTGRPDPTPQIQPLTHGSFAQTMGRMFRPGRAGQVEQVLEPARSALLVGSIKVGTRVHIDMQWGTVVRREDCDVPDNSAVFARRLTIMPLHPGDTFVGEVVLPWNARLPTRD